MYGDKQILCLIRDSLRDWFEMDRGDLIIDLVGFICDYVDLDSSVNTISIQFANNLSIKHKQYLHKLSQIKLELGDYIEVLDERIGYNSIKDRVLFKVTSKGMLESDAIVGWLRLRGLII